MRGMRAIEHIRKNVLEMTQTAFAELAGASQGTVSRWETGELEPDREQLDRIRSAAKERKGDEWDDSLFFEAPPEPERASA